MKSEKLKVKRKVRNEGRPGYKKTKVGWIPVEWECEKIRKLGDKKRPAIKAGPFGSSLKKEYYVENGYKIYGQEQVIAGDPFYGDYFIDEKRFNSLRSCEVLPGDILLSLVGTIGKALLIPPDCQQGIINPRLLRISLSKDKIFPLYVKYYLEADRTLRLLNSWAQGGTMGVLNAQIVGSIPVPLPPLPEQKKIAEILSAWDRAIEITNRLITNYELLKKGLMQQLLSGKIRFPEFAGSEKRKVKSEKLRKGQLPEGWREIQLKDIAAISFSGVDKKSRPGQKRVCLCNYMDVYNNNYITADMDFMWATATDAEIEKYSLNVGDIVITKDSETPNDIGVPAVVTEDLDNVICGYHLALIKPNLEKTDPIFLTKQIGYERVTNQFSRLANGVTRFGLTTSSVKGVKLWLPELKEQSRIAAVLSTCDREIELLKKKKEKLREQKKGLMQKLLSGEVRHPEFLQ